jgi:hypothetical protein
MVVVPPPMIVTVLPDTVATPVFELEYVTAKLEDEVAVRLNEASPNVFAASGPNVMV